MNIELLAIPDAGVQIGEVRDREHLKGKFINSRLTVVQPAANVFDPHAYINWGSRKYEIICVYLQIQQRRPIEVTATRCGA